MFRWFSDLIYFIYRKEASPPKDVICAEIIYCKLHCVIVKVFNIKQRSKLTEAEEFFRLHFHTIVHILLRLWCGATAELVAQKEESFFSSVCKAASCMHKLPLRFCPRNRPAVGNRQCMGGENRAKEAQECAQREPQRLDVPVLGKEPRSD